jgi:hypothetical protein
LGSTVIAVRLPPQPDGAIRTVRPGLFLSVQRHRVCLKEEAMTITKNLGMLLLAIYLILVGITALVHIAIPVLVTGILALAAGILILIGR